MMASHGSLTERTYPMPPGWRGSASFSEDGTFRYCLARHWHDLLTPLDVAARSDRQPAYLACIGTNPSAAEALRDDQTVRLLCNLARRRGYYGLTMLNAYAFRATSPAELRQRGYPVGPDNDRMIADIVSGFQYDVLACWGAIPPARDAELRNLLRSARTKKAGISPPKALRLSSQGQPVHPLRQPLGNEWVDLPL